MHVEDIKAEIRKRGTSAAEISRRLNVSRMAVSHVMRGGTSKRIAAVISEVTGIPAAKLWPGKYPDLEREQRGRRGMR